MKDLLHTAEPEVVDVVTQDSEEELESEDEGLDVVENHEVLEEEGVVVGEHAKRMSMKVNEIDIIKPFLLKNYELLLILLVAIYWTPC